MRVAIIHYWFVGMRGGEKVVEALCRLYPQADIFTHVYVPEAVSPALRKHRVVTSLISRLPFARRLYKAYLPLMPLALEQLDLRGYDLVISSESGPAKGVIAPPDALHVCYCHSPMRYVWNLYHDYKEHAGVLARAAMPLAGYHLRLWDVTSQVRVQHFIANSRCVANRIKAYYGRSATVIYPPVDVNEFASAPEAELEDFFLMVGELVPYKRADLAVEAFNRLGRKLVIIGGGEDHKRLRRLAGPNVVLMGPRPFAELKWHYARCKALIFPGEEDFGIVPVEAMASGRPVIAYGRGGALESVVEGVSGTFFREQTVESLVAAVARLDRMHFDRARIIESAQRFANDRFAEAFRSFVDTKMAERKELSGRADAEDALMSKARPAVRSLIPS